MKLRYLLLVLVALILLSTVVGMAILYRLNVWNARPPIANHTPASQEATRSLSLAKPTSTLLPPLVTPTPFPSPTVTPTSSPTPSPTPTATATPTHTPTPMPAARLSVAHRARQDGDYAVARTELHSVLQAPDAAWEVTEAGYQIGIVSYLQGDYGAAQETLLRFIEQHPKDHRAGAAHFYLAEALTHLGEYAAAIEHYTLYLEQQDVLADLIHTRIARNHMALGAHQAAVEAYKRALDRAPDLSQQYDLREQIALAYSAGCSVSAWGRCEEAIAWLQGIAELSENVYRLARIWYSIGKTYRLAGQEEQALQAFARAANGDPRPGHAHLALTELVDAGIEVNEYQRGLIDYHAGSYDAAVAAFRRYMETAPGYDREAHYYLALSHMEAGDLNGAIQACQEAIDLHMTPADPDQAAPNVAPPDGAARWGELWLLKGQALSRLGREDEAIKTYIGFAEAHPTHPLAPEARWRAAQLYEQAGHFQQAAGAYAALADAHAAADRAPAARFRAGISHYRSGDVDAAIGDWQELVDGYPASDTRPPPQESLAARYWLGKTLWTHGQVDEARLLLQTLADEQPRDYYGLRARHLIENRGQARQWHNAPLRPGPGSLHLTSDEEAEKQEAENWLRSWTDAPAQGELSALSTELAGHLLLRRAMEMNTLGLRPLARDTFEQLRQEIARDALSLYQLALATRDLELYAPSLRAAIDVIALAPEPSVIEMPRLIQRLAFPTYYSDLVLAECATQTLDPLLMFALIRQESVFDAEATSWAGAVGLAQVMPSTGEWIAEMTAWPEYTPEALQRAYLNVKFGAWFLARILEQAEGDVMTALAGYNGGPARAQGWLEQSNGDPDLLVEVISRDEPQRYVRLIYRHYDMYVRLYSSVQQ